VAVADAKREAIVAVLLPPLPPPNPAAAIRNNHPAPPLNSNDPPHNLPMPPPRRHFIPISIHLIVVFWFFYKNAGGWLIATCDSDFWSATRVERCRLRKSSSAASRCIFSGWKCTVVTNFGPAGEGTDIMVTLVDGVVQVLLVRLMQVPWAWNNRFIPSKNALLLLTKKSILHSILRASNTLTFC
jgi:hypothetical protein